MPSRIDFVWLFSLFAACGGDGSGPDLDGGGGGDGGYPDGDVPGACARCGGLQRGAPWPAEGADVRNQRRSLFAGPAQPTILWRSEVVAKIDRAAASVTKDGTIYAGGYGGLTVLRPDGSEIARTAVLSTLQTSAAEHGLVYLIDDFTNHVEKLNPATQERTLLFNYYANGSAALAPIVGADQRIYFGGIYGHAMSTSGDPLWSVLPTGSVQNGARCEHTPAIAPDGTLRFPCNEVLRAVDRQGQIMWSAPATASLDSSVAVDEQGNSYLCVSALLSIDAGGTQRFASDSCQSGTSPAIGDDGAIYFARYDELVALNSDGSERFRFPYYRNDGSSPAIDSEGTIYVAADIASDSGAYLIAIAPNGTEKWKQPIGTDGGSPSVGLDHRVYVTAFDTDNTRKLVAVGPL